MGVAITLADIAKRGLLGGGSGSSGGGSGIPQADIDAAFAALAEKGVNVPDGATSADLDDLIASIVTGGSGDLKFSHGTVFLAEKTVIGNTLETAFVVEHNLGEKPDVFIFAYVFRVSVNNANHLKLCCVTKSGTQTYCTISVAGKSPSSDTSASVGTTIYGSGYFEQEIITETTAKIVGNTADTYLCQDYGSQIYGYRWFAIKYIA